MSNRLRIVVSVSALLALSACPAVAFAGNGKTDEAVPMLVKDDDRTKMKDLLKDERKIVPFLKDDGMKTTIAKELAIQRIVKDDHLMKMVDEKLNDQKTMTPVRAMMADAKAMTATRDAMMKYDSAMKTMIQELMARNMVMSTDAAPKSDDKSRLKDMKETMLAREALTTALQDDGMKTALAKEIMIQQLMKDPELMKMITGRMSDAKTQTTMKGTAPDPKSVLSKDAILKATQELIARRMLGEASPAEPAKD
ncbi:MAG: hypothetical protein HYR85_07890 [Planctomycetes bacterium]|nr:hypothetical protein [Planctomycetota bacterium]MBI3848161.1 hypothetical protein [Planctomycetota bacterium]